MALRLVIILLICITDILITILVLPSISNDSQCGLNNNWTTYWFTTKYDYRDSLIEFLILSFCRVGILLGGSYHFIRLFDYLLPIAGVFGVVYNRRAAYERIVGWRFSIACICAVLLNASLLKLLAFDELPNRTLDNCQLWIAIGWNVWSTIITYFLWAYVLKGEAKRSYVACVR
jgi:hypothetical protein